MFRTRQTLFAATMREGKTEIAKKTAQKSPKKKSEGLKMILPRRAWRRRRLRRYAMQ